MASSSAGLTRCALKTLTFWRPGLESDGLPECSCSLYCHIRSGPSMVRVEWRRLPAFVVPVKSCGHRWNAPLDLLCRLPLLVMCRNVRFAFTKYWCTSGLSIWVQSGIVCVTALLWRHIYTAVYWKMFQYYRLMARAAQAVGLLNCDDFVTY